MAQHMGERFPEGNGKARVQVVMADGRAVLHRPGELAKTVPDDDGLINRRRGQAAVDEHMKKRFPDEIGTARVQVVMADGRAVLHRPGELAVEVPNDDSLISR